MKILDMVNEQMNFELESAYVYRGMAIYAAYEDFDGFAAWLDAQVREEIEHSEKMKAFLQEVGYKPTYRQMPKPEDSYESLLDVMKTALDHEKLVTKKITEIVHAAREEKDERVISFLQGFIDEQVEEEDTFSKLVTRLERIHGNMGALYFMDSQMGKRG